jgi:S1-C subfamily serine protease
VERRALATLLATLVLTGCSQPTGLESATTAIDATLAASVERPSLFHSPADLEKLTNQVRKATYVVECDSKYGSGYGYSTYWDGERQDFIVTTQTVIQQCLDLGLDPLVIDSEWESFGATIVASELEPGDTEWGLSNRDVALLRTNARGITTLEKVAPRKQTGSWLMTGSFPFLNEDFHSFAVTHGIIVSNSLNLGYATDAVTNPGSNGGVVVNSRGELLGTLYTPDAPIPDGIRFFLPFNQVVDLIEELREKTPARDFEPRLG